MGVVSSFCTKHNIILHHGQSLRILCSLSWNKLLRLRLRLYKLLHGVHRPIVHCYALCWNEEKILPFMFQHYEPFVDRFFIYDNYSDDHSESIIRSHPNAVLEKFSAGGQFNDFIHQDIKNKCWKRSRGKADFVIVCDTDEFLYHKDIFQAFKSLKKNGFSLVKPSGYNMYSSDYPIYQTDNPIIDQVKRGVRVPFFDKCILFDPHAIVEMNYLPGAHECSPWGKVKIALNSGFMLLHFKYLGIDWLIERNRQYAQRLSKDNIENEFGIEYFRKENAIIEEFEINNHEAVTVI